MTYDKDDKLNHMKVYVIGARQARGTYAAGITLHAHTGWCDWSTCIIDEVMVYTYHIPPIHILNRYIT